MERTFAVCPQGLEEAEVQVLEKAHADFRAIPPTQRVTLYWLQVGLPYCNCTSCAQCTTVYSIRLSAVRILHAHRAAAGIKQGRHPLL